MARVQLEADSRPIRRAEQDLRQLNRTGERTESVSNRMRNSFRLLGGVLATLGAARAWNAVLSATIEQERVTAQLEQTLRSTGRYTPELSRQMQDYAASLQGVTTFGDEAVIASQSLLLTFTQIGGDVFPRAQEAILDVSTAMGTDLRSSALQVGKALNDPILGISALSRTGIQFSDVQQQNIRDMVEMGDVAAAQRIILSELETQFGGSARAARNTLGGAIQSLKNSFGDLLEGDTGDEGVSGAVEAINQLTETLNDPAVVEGLNNMVQGLFNVAEGAARAVPPVIDFVQSVNDGEGVLGRAGTAYANYANWFFSIGKNADDAKESVDEFNDAEAPQIEAPQVASAARDDDGVNAEYESEIKSLSDAIQELTYSQMGEQDVFEAMMIARKAGVEIGSDEFSNILRLIDARNELTDTIERQEGALSEFNQMQAQMEAQELRSLDAIGRVEQSMQSRLDIIQKAYEEEQITQEQAHQAQLLALRQFEDERDQILEERRQERLEAEKGYWDRWLDSAETSLTNFDELAGNTIENFSRSFGQAFSEVVMEGGSAMDILTSSIQSLGQSTIAALGEMAAQWLAYQAVQMVTGKSAQAGAAGAKAAEASATSVQAGLNAFAATAAIPIVGPGLAPGAAAGAISATAPMAATVASLMAGSVAARRNGGAFMGGQDLLVGESGPERIRMPGPGRVTPYNDLMREAQSDGGQAAAPIYLNVSIDEKAQQDSVSQRVTEDKRIIDVVVANGYKRGKVHKMITDTTSANNTTGGR